MKNLFDNFVSAVSSFFNPHPSKIYVPGESIVLRSVKGGTITSIGIRRSPITVTEDDRKLFNLSPDLYPIKEN